MVGFEGSPLNHVEDSAWSATDNVSAMLQLENVVIDISTSNTAVNFNLHIVA